MPSRSPHVPQYRHSRPKDLAVVRVDGRDHYLGRYGSEQSREKYRQLIAEFLSEVSTRVVARPARHPVVELTVEKLASCYMESHVSFYYVKDGRPTSEQDNIRQALRFARRLHGHTKAADLGQLALKSIRQSMIVAGRSRNVINKDINRIRAMFRWAVENELVDVTIFEALRTVSSLRRGRSAAKETAPVRPVPEATVNATLNHTSPTVTAMVRLQLLTGARPGEITALKPADVDRTDPTGWLYKPSG